jgi:hypothetical protein
MNFDEIQSRILRFSAIALGAKHPTLLGYAFWGGFAVKAYSKC